MMARVEGSTIVVGIAVAMHAWLTGRSVFAGLLSACVLWLMVLCIRGQER